MTALSDALLAVLMEADTLKSNKDAEALADQLAKTALATLAGDPQQLVDAGVLVQAESVTDDGGDGLVWIDDLVETSPTVDVGPRDWDEHLPHMVRVYRIGSDHA